MANLETWIPYCRLYQNRKTANSGARKVVIGDTRASLSESGYGTGSIMGLQDVNIKYGMGYVTVDVSMPIHQNIIQASQLGTDSEMARIFALENKWEVEFGWSHSKYGGYKLDRMTLADWSLDYDQSIRSFVAKLKLVPSHSFLLTDIKVYMLAREVAEFKQILSDVEGEEDGKKYEGGHPLSLGNVITKVLDGCRRVIRDSNWQPYNDKPVDRRDIRINTEGLSTWGGFAEGYADNEETRTRLNSEEYKQNEREKKKSKIIEGFITYPSFTLRNADPDDIPDPDAIRMTLIGESAEDNNSVAEAFHSEKPDKIDAILKFTEASSANMNILQFITQYLSDNAFSIMASFAAVNRKGRTRWIILQSDFNNIGKQEESEYEGIRNKPTPVSAEKIVYTFGGKTGRGTNSQIFDLHSNRNVVISVNASTEQGRSTIGTSYAADAVAQQENAYGAGNTIKAHKNRMWAYLAQEAKELNLETIGLPQITIGDNIFVNLAGPLYSGKYKIIEMEHKFDGSFTSSLRAIRTKTGLNLGADPHDKEKEVEVPPEPNWDAPVANDEVRFKNDGSGRVKLGRDKKATFEGDW